MSQIETEHLGFKIVYSDNRDVWFCYELDLDAPILSKLKTKIDAFERRSRKIANPWPVIYFDYHDRPSRVAVVSVDKYKDSTRENWQKCWIVTASGAREHVSVGQLAPISFETEANLILALTEEIARLSAKRHEIGQTVTKYTRETLLAASPTVAAVEDKGDEP